MSNSNPAISKSSKFNPLVVLLVISLGMYLVARLWSKGTADKSRGSAITFRSDENSSVGLVEIKGVILDSKRALKDLREMEENKRVASVVLRLNSPGGAVAPSQEIYSAVKAFPKPLVISMGSVAASGAYYIAAGAKRVYANPGTLTGSIGVIMEFVNLSKLYDWAKIERYSIKSGKFKEIGSDHRSMTPDERALLQATVDEILEQFRAAVLEGRKLKPEALKNVADGRVFSGSQAKRMGLVDELGGIREAIDEASSLGKIKGKPKIVSPTGKGDRWLNLLMDNANDEEFDYEDEASRASMRGVFERILEGLGVPISRNVRSEKFQPGVYFLWDRQN